MSKRKEKDNSLPVVAESPEFLKKLARDQKKPNVAKRVTALYQVAAGIAKTTAGAARSLGIDGSGLGKWFKVYTEQGLEAFISSKKRGRPFCSALRRPEVYAFLLRRLTATENAPTGYKGLWREVLAEFPDVSYTYEGFHKALNSVFEDAGLKVPRQVHPEQEPGAVEAYKKKGSAKS